MNELSPTAQAYLTDAVLAKITEQGQTLSDIQSQLRDNKEYVRTLEAKYRELQQEVSRLIATD